MSDLKAPGIHLRAIGYDAIGSGKADIRGAAASLTYQCRLDIGSRCSRHRSDAAAPKGNTKHYKLMEIARMAPLGRISSKTHRIGFDLVARKLLVFSIKLTAWLIFSHTASAATYDLLVSGSATRSSAMSLSGQTFSGNIYVYTNPDRGVAKVSFYLDDPKMSGSPQRVERRAPYDLAGTTKSGSAAPFDTTQLATGKHTIIALVALSGGGTVKIQRSFAVATGGATSRAGAANLSWVAPSTRTDGTPLSLSAIAGYRIYHGTAANQLSLLRNLNDPTATTYTASSLPVGRHYFALTTYDTSGLESAKSKIVSKTVQ